MKLFAVRRLSIFVFLLWFWSCATPSRAVNPYFEMPPEQLLIAERELFSLALQKQKNNKLKSSVGLWKRFLANNPRSFRGYNNLGMVYYTNNQLSLALSAFETAIDLEPLDHKIKENLKIKPDLKYQIINNHSPYLNTFID